MNEVVWQAGKGYAACGTCHKIVCVNKTLFGSLHICLTVCEKRGHHSGPYFWHRRVGPFWARRDEFRCRDCNQIVSPT